ncbi:hypothetical protein CSUI_004361 [Cystoisospora suis]|uniref:Uncharacterized protein n=1 Tax=Cystoisospora suis TaxID=483139 RepID=A0A2C6KBV7_9APIC|nr:hypothetical protein CSUI_004361 [Cystoisospora suis]
MITRPVVPDSLLNMFRFLHLTAGSPGHHTRCTRPVRGVTSLYERRSCTTFALAMLMLIMSERGVLSVEKDLLSARLHETEGHSELFPANTSRVSGNTSHFHQGNSAMETLDKLGGSPAAPCSSRGQTVPLGETTAIRDLQRADPFQRFLRTRRIVIPSRKRPGSETVIHIATKRKGRDNEDDEEFDDETFHIEARLQNRNGEFLDLLEETGEGEKALEEEEETGETKASEELGPDEELSDYRPWWYPSPEDLTDDMPLGIARNSFRETKLEMPHPLVPVNGTGFQPEPILPEHLYPHEVRCPAGWLGYGPHCLSIVAVPGWTTCPGDKSFKRRGLRSKMVVSSPGICALTRETGPSLVCPRGYEPHFSDIVDQDSEKGKSKTREPVGRAFTCTQSDSIPAALLDGKPCPLGYTASEFGTCEGKKQVGPSVSCPEGFILGGEQTNPYAILNQEYAKCGAVEYYRGRVRVPIGAVGSNHELLVPSENGAADRCSLVNRSRISISTPYLLEARSLRGPAPATPAVLIWCPDGFVPLGFNIPNLPFGSSLDAFGVIDKLTEAAGIPRHTKENRAKTSWSNSKIPKARRVVDELRLFFPETVVGEVEASILTERKEDEAAATAHETAPLSTGDAEDFSDENIWILDEYDDDNDSVPVDDEMTEAIQPWEISSMAYESVSNSEAARPSGGVVPRDKPSESHTRGRSSSSTAKAPHPSSKREETAKTFGSPRVDEWSSKTGYSAKQRRMAEGGPRPAIPDATAAPDLYAQLQAKIPPGGACVQVVGVLEARCNKYECRGDNMQKIEKIVYDWVDYRLRVDIRQVKMFIPNGKDFRRTTPG